MQAPPSLHPSEQMLQAFGNGQLDGASAEAVSTHLDECEDCLLRVAGISSDGFLEAFRRARSTERMSSERAATDRSKSSAATGDGIPAELANHPDYEIRRELGRGGMGVVYLAHNRLMGLDQVLNVMGRHIVERPGVMERFLREIRTVAQLRHPNIVTAHHAFRSGECLVFAMEYVDGLDLARMVKARGPMPVGHAYYYVQQAALGLQHAHERGIVHRDIKPGNLMLARNGDRALIKVLDFGLAKASLENKVVELAMDDGEHSLREEANLTHTGQMLGTPDFIAPEQIDDAQSADLRADIYSLGCTLYYLLSGGPPFPSQTLYDVLQAHHSTDARLLNFVRPEVPAELAALVAKMMAKEPESRFQTPDEVAKALPPFFKKRGGTAVALGLGFSQAGPLDTSLYTAGARELSTSHAPASVSTPKTATARTHDRPEQMWESLIDFKEPEDSAPTVANEAKAAPQRPRWLWPAVAAGALLFALIAVWAAGVFKGKTRGQDALAAQPTDQPARHEAERESGESTAKTELNEQLLYDARMNNVQRCWEDANIELMQQVLAECLPTNHGGIDRRGFEWYYWQRKISSGQITLMGHTSHVNDVAFSPDGSRLASASFDGTVKVWDAGTGQETLTLKGHTDGVISVAFSPDGSRIASATDSTVKVWDAGTGQESLTLKGHAAPVSSVAFSPDGKRLASASSDRTVKVWDAGTGQETLTSRCLPARSLAWRSAPTAYESPSPPTVQ